MAWEAKFGGLMLATLLAGASLSSAASKERVAIQPMEIARAISTGGVRISPDQIEQLSSVSAAEPSPKLQLVELASLDGDLMKARLRCESSKVCLPFYVLVHWHDADASKDGASSSHQFSLIGSRQLARKESLVHKGQTATMIFDGENIHMTLPVICLQNAGRGQWVRVASTDTKRTFMAQVTGERTVRAGAGAKE